MNTCTDLADCIVRGRLALSEKKESQVLQRREEGLHCYESRKSHDIWWTAEQLHEQV